MIGRAIAKGVLLATAVPAVCWGLDATATLRDVAVIQDGVGSARLLFRAGPEVTGLSDVAIWKATLTLSVTGAPVDRTQSLRIYPIMTPWNAATTSWTAGWRSPGGDYDPEVFATADVSYRTGTATVAFDVTGMLKGIVEHGMTADGFLLTADPKDGVGIPLVDVARFGSMTTASFDVRYRNRPHDRLP